MTSFFLGNQTWLRAGPIAVSIVQRSDPSALPMQRFGFFGGNSREEIKEIHSELGDHSGSSS